MKENFSTTRARPIETAPIFQSRHLLFAVLVMLAIIVAAFGLMTSETSASVWWIEIALLIALALAVFFTRRQPAVNLEGPLPSIRQWASEIRQGNFSARLPETRVVPLEGLTDDINRLAEWLESLAEDQEAQLVAKQHQLERQSGHVLRLEERSQLANELHDSLAQTLAGLKIQVRVLDDTLRQDNESAVWREMERIQAALDTANTELRDLITHFRAPINQSGVIPAIEKLISRFRVETDIEAVFQNQCPEIKLPQEREMQVTRIVQESLNNVRRHSHANMVRVFMGVVKNNRLRLLVEDDGVGFDQEAGTGSNHFGLVIMVERAESIGGKLKVESEHGEGTRVILHFQRTWQGSSTPPKSVA